MKNILLPTDFSENSWNAIVYALHYFEKMPCNFYLLHVNRLSNLAAENTSYPLTQEAVVDIYTLPAKRRLRQLLKRIAKQLLNYKHHKFYTLTDYNFFIESVRNHVNEKNIDMIVMGTKGASGIQKFIIGSNTGAVITKVQCTTLVVPENAKFAKINEVAFPTDFALSYDINTLIPISEILETYKSSLRILHISKKGEELNLDQQNSKDLLEDFFEGYNYNFHFLTHKKIESAIQCFVESRDIDLIAMVAKNLNYFQRILFSPTVETISYHTDIPFLVLHQ